ncbi:MAG: hypothetical protein ACR2LR_28540 [Hassallia sp.]
MEDASAGVQGALIAGMGAVGLGPVERVGKAHVVLPSLENVCWQDLQQQIVTSDNQAALLAGMAR